VSARVLVFAGLGLIAATLFASQRSEWIDLHRFLLCWIGVLIALQGLALWRRGSTPLRSLGDWVAVGLGSVVFWDIFELVNLRLRNWWYTGISPNPFLSALYGGLCFATVLPAVALGLHALGGPAPRPGPRVKKGALVALGLGLLGVSMAFPRQAFPLAWFFLWPLCEAALPEPMKDRDYKRLLLLALPLGLTWEALNWGCARGWVYTVPGFEGPKLFEMPLPGYLGYLPFLLEAGAALALLAYLRPRLTGGRAWGAVLAVVAFHFAIDPIARGATDLSYAEPKVAGDPASEMARATLMGVTRARRYVALGIADLRALARADWQDLARRSGDDPALVRLFIAKARR
jgi:hypothetical protein